MNTIISDYLLKAQRGETVYITDVRRSFEGLEADRKTGLIVVLTTSEGIVRQFDLVVPKFDVYAQGDAARERAFIVEYFLAELYNILSSLGARSIRFYDPDGKDEAQYLYRAFYREFGINLSRKERSNYGKSINVIERMLDAINGTADSKFECSFIRGNKEVSEEANDKDVRSDGSMVSRMHSIALGEAQGKSILGIDVGGTDIKLALAMNGRLAALKEYDWFPASFTRVNQLVEPILALTRLMIYKAITLKFGDPGEKLAAILKTAMDPHASDAIIFEALDKAEHILPSIPGSAEFRLDAIGLSFPDVVVKDKIVGGEVYKTRGIRLNPAIDYEKEFRQLAALDEQLAVFVKNRGVVASVNDGSMAAFTAAIEMAELDEAKIREGVFAHTLGTELGTGWVTKTGTIPDIPLEVYNFIIDLGSYPERAYKSDDVRSVNNFNTGLPGTLQKYTSQSGAFRLALKYFPQSRPQLYKELFDRGYLKETADGIYVPTEPKDMRKPFLEFLMNLPARGEDPEVERIFTEIGEFLAVAYEECEHILSPATHTRILFGRMVKNPVCFDLMQKGARKIAPDMKLELAADDMAMTPLMKQLKENREHTVAQFAQAVGSVYYAAFRSAHDQRIEST